MLRISESRNGEQTTVQINGGLVGEYARLTEQCCARTLAAGRRVRVLLRHLTAIDEAGRQLLAALVRRGVKLQALDLYSKELLRVIRRSAGGRSRQPRSA
ncbi:MAG: hypothetical protein ACP5U2_18040 [Bryobacteraceae bacterium]